MIKWFLYIVLILIFSPRLSFAKSIAATRNDTFNTYHISQAVNFTLQQRDTSLLKGSKPRATDEDKKKIKEIAKAKKLPKPVKVEEIEPAKKPKPKRQRRPDGLERPPEIPRRNNN